MKHTGVLSCARPEDLATKLGKQTCRLRVNLYASLVDIAILPGNQLRAFTNARWGDTGIGRVKQQLNLLVTCAVHLENTDLSLVEQMRRLHVHLYARKENMAPSQERPVY